MSSTGARSWREARAPRAVLRALVRGLTRGILGARLPTHAGRIELARGAGPGAPVVISRDDFGVPYIAARDEGDAWFALGFCHGQDRAGQLELLVRTVRGTLAAVGGPDVVAIDRLARRVGFRRVAPEQLARAPAVVRAQLDAYARGVNAGIERGLGRRGRAHEHALLRCEPTRWEAADVQALFSFLCFTLASNWDIELARLKILEEDGPGALLELDPAYPRGLPVTAPTGALAAGELDALARDLLLFEKTFALRGGSNAWVLAGARTRSGRPLLANDPHMPPAAPPLWYLAHIRTPTWSACGATFIGTPGFGCGHNGHAAWGVTAAHADNTDLFLEELGPDGRSVREGSRLVPCARVVERIEVRGGEDVLEDILITPRGPVVSGAAIPEGPWRGPRRALSLAATWLRPRAYEGLMQVHTARSFEDFRERFRVGAQATVSLVYADVGGTIGWVLASELPRRGRGHGVIPLPAWEPGASWLDEPVPFDSMPRERDSAAGFYATANNQPRPAGDGPFLGVDWLDGYRQATLVERLAARDDWDVRASQRLQLDLTSRPWREIRGVVLAALDGAALDESGLRARALLRAWDGRVAPESPAAGVYCLLIAGFARRVVHARAPGGARWALGEGFTALLPHNLLVTRRLGHLARLVREQPPGFFARAWPEEIADALATVAGALRRRLGADERRWAWGRARDVQLAHLLGIQAPLDLLFNVPELGARFGGDSSTIAQGTFDLEDATRNAVAIPVLRAVMDVGDWDACRFSLAGGQAGNPFSRNYADLLEHHDLGGIPIAWSRGAIERRVCQRLELRPADE
ncbi:MAG: penicillin acylase family protein [Myxococcales bacterium]|nr:penicillin acylase family protein [Myxococcales bacterium]